MKTFLLCLLVLLPMRAFAEARVAFEAGAGIGTELGAGNDVAANVDVGVGAWLDPRTALTLRAASWLLPGSDPDPSGIATVDTQRRAYLFVGPSLQRRLGDRVWVGGGLGVATMVTSDDAIWGAGLDLRVGYAFTRSLGVSLEVSPKYFPSGGPITNTGTGIMKESATTTGAALALSYQL